MMKSKSCESSNTAVLTECEFLTDNSQEGIDEKPEHILDAYFWGLPSGQLKCQNLAAMFVAKKKKYDKTETNFVLACYQNV